MLAFLPTGRAILIAGLVTLALAGCGRRGALEPPPGPVVQAPPGARDARRPLGAVPSQVSLQGQGASPGSEVSEDDEPVSVVPSPVPTPPPTRSRNRGYVVPKEPFILDPLL